MTAIVVAPSGSLFTSSLGHKPGPFQAAPCSGVCILADQPRCKVAWRPGASAQPLPRLSPVSPVEHIVQNPPAQDPWENRESTGAPGVGQACWREVDVGSSAPLGLLGSTCRGPRPTRHSNSMKQSKPISKISPRSSMPQFHDYRFEETDMFSEPHLQCKS